MAQLVNRLPHKHGSLSLKLQRLCEEPGIVTHVFNPSAGEVEMGGFLDSQSSQMNAVLVQ